MALSDWAIVQSTQNMKIQRAAIVGKRKETRKGLRLALIQVQVFRLDGWICRWCGRPVIFAPAMKYLQEFR